MGLDDSPFPIEAPGKVLAHDLSIYAIDWLPAAQPPDRRAESRAQSAARLSVGRAGFVRPWQRTGALRYV